MLHILSGVSQGSNYNIKQSNKQLLLRTARITQHTALTSQLSKTAHLLSFSHTLFSDSICLRQCECFVRCWCSSIAGLPTPPTAFDPSRRRSHPEMPICASTSSSEICVCVCVRLYLAQVHTHLHCRTVCGLPP